MPQVKHNFNLVLHRGHGEKISDPDFLSQNDPLKNKSKGSRCSFKFGLFFLKKSPTKETSNNFETKMNPVSKFDYYINKNKIARISATSASILLFTLTTLFVFPIVPKVNQAEGATEEGDSETLLTISAGESADLDITATKAAGTFAQSSDAEMATFTVTTTNYTGYTLNLSGNESDLISTGTSESSSTNSSIASISSISSAVSANDFASTDTDKTALYNNKWGYQVNLCNSNCDTVSSITSTATYTALKNGNFLPAPAIADPDNKEVSLNITSDANGSTKHPDPLDTYAIRLGARIDYTVPTGIYTNTFTIAAVANPVSYTISYNDTSGDSTVTGSPINPKVVTTGQTPTGIGDTTINATLYNDGVPTRTGYTFNKWCYGTVTHATGSASTCNGTEYSKGASFTINRTIDNSDIVLHAMWTPNTYMITYGTVNGISSVSLNGTACSTLLSSGGCTKTLTYANTYNLSATASTGYSFSSWNAGSYGKVNSTSSASTTYMVGAGNSTITPAASINTYNVKVNFAGSGVSSVVFSASGYTTRTVSSSGGTAALTYGVRYTVTMNFSSTSYGFSSWALNSSSYGTLSSTTSNSTYFTPNASSGSAVITATGKTLKTYIQDFTKTMCQSQASSASKTVYDKRDEKDYQVRYINGNCWMVQNLRYVGDSGSASGSMVMKSATSNISANKTVSYTDLTSGETYDYAKIHDSGNAFNGIWYNYAATTAMTITGSSNTGEVTNDICPKGWNLPTGSKFTGILSYMDIFFKDGVPTGFYSTELNGNGNWWSVTNGGNDHTRLTLYGTKASAMQVGNSGRRRGMYIRCILK